MIDAQFGINIGINQFLASFRIRSIVDLEHNAGEHAP